MLGAVSLPSIPTGNSLIVRPNTLPAQTGGGGTTPMSPGQSAVAMFADMRDSLESIVLNTSKTVSLLSKLVTGEKIDDRRESIERAETDEDIPPAEDSGGGGGGPGFLASLNKLNPFSSESGALVKFIAAGLALIGLNIFKDKLIPKLSALLNFFFGDDENSFDKAIDAIGLKVREITDKIKEKVLPIWEDVKTETELFVEKVGEIYNLVASIVKGIGNYLLSFDVKGATGPAGMPIGDGKLDEDELKAVTKDITDRLTKGIFGFLDGIVGTVLSGLTLYAIGTTALRLLMTRGALAAGAGAFLAGGIFSIAAAAVVIAAGIFKLGDNIMTAYNDAVTDELGKDQDFSMKEFVTRLLVGKETGNKLKDVLKNAADKAIIGGSLGFVIGGPLGAAVGALAGGLVGGFATYVGSKETEKFIENAFGDNSIIGMTVNYLVDVYKKLILDPFEFLFGKLGVENDSLLARLGYEFDRDKPLNKEEMYGSMATGDQSEFDGTSTSDLQSLLDEKTKQLEQQPKTKPIVVKGFFSGKEYTLKEADYLDTHNVRKLKGEISTINQELMDRGVVPNPNAKQDSNKALFVPTDPVMQKLMDMGATFDATGQGDFVLNQQGTGVNNSFNKQEQSFINADLTAGMNDDEIEALVKGRL